ncbi:MAG: head-tail connector protein [Bacillota bacterium]
MMLLDEVKSALRVDGDDNDIEIQALIDAAVADLVLSGVAAEKARSEDPLVKRAVIVYCRAHFDYDDKAAPGLLQSYAALKAHLALSEDYGAVAVTFEVRLADGTPVSNVAIELADKTLYTNSQGVAIYRMRQTDIDVAYVVWKSGYATIVGSVYVDGSRTVSLILTPLT